MFKGACRLDDSVHRTIILRQHFQVKQFRLRSEDYPYTYFRRSGCLGGPLFPQMLQRRVRPTGLEPVTPRSEVWCSIQLSYGRAWLTAVMRLSTNEQACQFGLWSFCVCTTKMSL